MTTITAAEKQNNGGGEGRAVQFSEQPKQQEQMVATEMLTIPTEMAQIIHNDLDPNAFNEWQADGNFKIEAVTKIKSMRLFPMSQDPTENESLLSRIWPLLERAQKQKMEQDNNKFVVTIALLLPAQKCGYVVGKKLKTLDKVKEDFGVEAFLDNGKREPIPKDFARIFVRSPDINAMRGARAEIRRLEKRSLDFNPYGLPRHAKEGDEQLVEERIRLPAWDQFSKTQKGHIVEIQKTSSIDWTFDEQQSLAEPTVTREGRFVTLSGEPDLVVEAKKRLAKLISEIEDNQCPGSTVQLCSSPTTGRTEYRLTMRVPSPTWRRVIGVGGVTIRALRDRFGVHLGFLGDNQVEYPEFRLLRITGPSADSVQRVRKHIQREFIQAERPAELGSSNGSGRTSTDGGAQRQNGIIGKKEEAEGKDTKMKQEQNGWEMNNNNNNNISNATSPKNNKPLGGWEETDSNDSWGDGVDPDFGGGQTQPDEDEEEEEKTVENEEEIDEEEAAKNTDLLWWEEKETVENSVVGSGEECQTAGGEHAELVAKLEQFGPLMEQFGPLMEHVKRALISTQAHLRDKELECAAKELECAELRARLQRANNNSKK